MKGKKLILMPFNLPWEWSTDYTNQTAFVLGKKNIVVCYMWCDLLSLKEYFVKRRIPILIKRYSKNIIIYTPILFIPFRRLQILVRLNEKINIVFLNILIRFLELKHKISEKIVWVFDPQIEPFTANFKLGWKTVYDCVDFFTGDGKSQADRDTLKLENRLATNADYVFANSMVLQNHLKKVRRDTILIPQGFRVESFSEYKKTSGTANLKKKGRPLIGFVGGINQRLDYPLLINLVKRHLEWDFVLWGPILEPHRFKKSQVDLYKKLLAMPNVFTGQSGKSEIPAIVSQFDIGMIPYDISDNFNKFCYPMKIFEFFYFGKPVVSTEIVELKRFPKLVKIGKNYLEWEKIISGILKNTWPAKYKQLQKDYAIKNSWDNKVAEILTHIK